MISIIHPSRSRPDKSAATIKKWVDFSGIPKSEIEIFYCLDVTDPLRHEYRFYPDCNGSPKQGRIIANNENAIDAINLGAKICSGNILIVVSDDTSCPENWAKDLIEALEGKSDFIIKTQDGIQDWIITMPIMDRKYYERFGYIYHPSYSHCFADTELTCVAELTGRLILMYGFLFLHKHYSLGFGEKDDVNVKADATFEVGKSNFINRKSINFGLENPPGNLSSNVYTRM